MCCLSCCAVGLTSETPHPGHPCLDSFSVSSHLKLVENWLPSPLVCDSYCSSAAHKSAGPGCLLKGGIWVKGHWALSFGPLTPDGTSRFLRLSWVHFPPPHFTPQPSSCCHPMSPGLPTLFLPDNPTHFLFSPLGPRPTGLHPSSLFSLSLSLCRDSTPFLAVGDPSKG